jgi:alkylation response protein AidB-like acyl-CoA dehydrogenase
MTAQRSLVPQDLVDRASALVPLLAANAARTEREGNVVPENLAALRDAGLLRLGTPQRYGGYELGIAAQMEIVLQVGRGCASTGWIVANDAGSKALMIGLTEQAHEEILGRDPDTLVYSSVASAQARATKVNGGVMLSGPCPWASGSEIAEWAVLISVPIGDGPESPTSAVTVAARTQDLDIERTWNVSGLRGTGTQTVLTNQVFIPEHRCLFHDYSATGRYDQRFFEIDPNYSPTGPTAGILVSLSALIGATQGALDHTRELLAKGEPITHTIYQNKADSPAMQLAFAEATHLVDTAFLHLRFAAQELEQEHASGVALSWTGRTRVRMHLASAIQRARESFEKLLDIGGASSFASTNPLQRHWRDFAIGSRHALLNIPISLEDYSRALLDITPTVTIFQ